MKVREVIGNINKKLDSLLGGINETDANLNLTLNSRIDLNNKFAKDSDDLHPQIIAISYLKLKKIQKYVKSIKNLDAPVTLEAFKPLIDYIAELADEQDDDACYALNHRIRMNEAVLFIVDELTKCLKPKFYDFLLPNLSEKRRAHVEKLKPHEFVIGENDIPIIIYDCVAAAANNDAILRHTYDPSKPLTPSEQALVLKSSALVELYYDKAKELKEIKEKNQIEQVQLDTEKARQSLYNSLKGSYHFAKGAHGVLGMRRLSERVFAEIKDLNQLLEIMTTLIPDKLCFPEGKCGCQATQCIHQDRWKKFFEEASADILFKFLEKNPPVEIDFSTQKKEVSTDLSKNIALEFFMTKKYLPTSIKLFEERINANSSNLKKLVAVFLSQGVADWEKGLSLLSTTTLSNLLLGKDVPDRDAIYIKSQDPKLYIQNDSRHNHVVQLLFAELYRRYMKSMSKTHDSFVGSTADTIKNGLKKFGSFIASASETVLSVNDRNSKIAAVDEVVIPCLCDLNYGTAKSDVVKFMQEKNLMHHYLVIFGSKLVNNPLSSMLMNQNLLSTLVCLRDQYSDPAFYLKSAPLVSTPMQQTSGWGFKLPGFLG